MNLKNPSISARVIADSVNPVGNRLTSLVITIPRIVLAEFNTHRALSRNSASSRAIPFDKMVEQVMTNPFVPTAFQKEHTGMQGMYYFDEEMQKLLKEEWLHSRDEAVLHAKSLSGFGVTKQLCNRLLEPFLMHTIIATATEWENFIALRAHEQAEIHIQDAGNKVLDALNRSTPVRLKAGDWHIPFGDNINDELLTEALIALELPPLSDPIRSKAKVQIAIARCARVSYMNFEGKDDYVADIKLFNRLLDAGHMSPFEHVGMAMAASVPSGNFIGFAQYRKALDGENKKDNRLKEIKWQ
jgi:thymidylate synthase ThyX